MRWDRPKRLILRADVSPTMSAACVAVRCVTRPKRKVGTRFLIQCLNGISAIAHGEVMRDATSGRYGSNVPERGRSANRENAQTSQSNVSLSGKELFVDLKAEFHGWYAPGSCAPSAHRILPVLLT